MTIADMESSPQQHSSLIVESGSCSAKFINVDLERKMQILRELIHMQYGLECPAWPEATMQLARICNCARLAAAVQ